MDKLNQIIAVAGSLATLFAALLTVAIKFVKSAKAKRVAEQALKLMEVLQPLIVDAEKFANYTGEEKKQFVQTRVNQYALKNSIAYNANAVDKLIEDILLTTKNVNARAKDTKNIFNQNQTTQN